ncbi:hypothetical protein BST81_17440 [Leptolyngbya sp. 'hensonii']|uniref:CHAT domain-containing tetratricopeptide repeat protein n=1 Tax=Leptolyngbya sp. 'hensonii' TaxID=1922337 RepID=UPI0009502541|nr:CHAT domain-containing tetratricopeptide repeat protein [Leptolyngbya sp. 'hensonii']OLP17135.1 hypothetical protein BST81_17440 [Leptolyngbya sp. 'hensonii']
MGHLKRLALSTLLVLTIAPGTIARQPLSPAPIGLPLAQTENPDPLLDQGFDQLNQRDFKGAAQSYERALQLYQDRNQADKVSEAQYGLARAYLLLGNYASAIQLFKQLGPARNAAQQGTILSNLGLAYFQAGQLLEAEQTLRRAIAAWESVRSLDNVDTNQITLFEQQAYTYRLLLKVLVARNQTDAALELSEWSRARALVELLAQRSATTRPTIPPTLQQIRHIARTQNSTLVEYAIVGDEVRVLGDEPETETDLYIWVIRPTGEVTFRRVDLKPLRQGLNELNQTSGLVNLVRDSRSALGIPSRGLVFQENLETIRVATAVDRTHPKLQKLHQLLIQPIADLLPTQPEARITFIPQGPLFLVSFASLQDQKSQYLIEQHTILTTPSIQLLALTHQQRRSPRSLTPALVVGNPTMPSFASEPGIPPRPLASLPGSEQEARAIAALLGTTPILGSQATKARILELIGKSRVIHLATHGLLDLDPNLTEFGLPVDPNGRTARQSRVFVTPGAVIVGPNVRVGGVAAESALAREKVVQVDMPGLIALAPSGQDNGFLSAKALLQMRLQADLVVLSACNTGRGRVTGDGVVGLARSLIGAGVPSVVVSLWAVPDAPTATLMTHFYQNLKQRPDKARALRQAMLATMKEYPDPKAWAAFTLIGEAE